MQMIKVLMVGLLIAVLAADELLAQAIGEYGRTVEGAGRRQSNVNQSTSRPRSQNGKGKSVVEGIDDVGGRPIPSALVVTSRQAALYPRQDDESEKLTELLEGDSLITLGQSNGGNQWYMVKTQKGLIGWIKSADVKSETSKKP